MSTTDQIRPGFGPTVSLQTAAAFLSAISLLTMVVLGPLTTLGAGSVSGDGNPARQAGYLFAFACSVVATRPLSRPFRLFPIPASLVVALLWCWISLFWAIAPAVAARRLGLTTLVIWTIFLVVPAIGYRRILDVTRWVLVIAIAASYVVVALWPEIGIHQADTAGDPGLIGDWRGILPQKNYTGALCGIAILIFVFDADRLSRPVRWLVLVAAGVFLIQTGSKTSLGILLMVLPAGFLLGGYRVRYLGALPALLLLGAAAVTLLESTYGAALRDYVSDPTALTGRGELWALLRRYAQDHWLLGAGFGSFWNIGPFSPVYSLASGWVTEYTAGHNGYLDLLTQVGVPGLILVVTASFLVPLGRLLTTSAISPSRRALIGAVLLFCAGHNLTESTLFDRDFFIQTMVMLAIALVWAADPSVET